MSERKKFVTTGLETVPFDVDDQSYVLKPASGAAARKYREASFAGAEMDYETGEDSSKRVTLRRMQAVAGVESVLVAECCFDSTGKKVSLDLVESWPGEVQKWAFAEVKRISPWLDESSEAGLAELRKQRDKLDARIKKLEESDPKA